MQGCISRMQDVSILQGKGAYDWQSVWKNWKTKLNSDPLVYEQCNFISQEAQGTDENPLLDITRDTLAHDLVDTQTATSGCQEPNQSNEPDNEVVDNEKYLEEMEIDRNWQIPREKLEILEEKLGTGEFGVVCKGFYLRRDGRKLPVAIKTLKGLCSIFWYSQCISSNIIIDN